MFGAHFSVVQERHEVDTGNVATLWPGGGVLKQMSNTTGEQIIYIYIYICIYINIYVYNTYMYAYTFEFTSARLM